MNIATTLTPKARKTVSTFTEREASIYELGIGYIKQDMEHILNCQKEITVYNNPNQASYTAAIKAQTNLTFRAAYMLQCLGVYVYSDFEKQIIEVKTISDK